MAEPQSPDEDLDVTLRWPGGAPAGPADPAVTPDPGPPRPPRSPVTRPPVRIRSGGSAVAALRDDVAELRAQVDALAAELEALRNPS